MIDTFDAWLEDRKNKHEKRPHLQVFEHARMKIRLKWPFMLSALYSLTPVAREDIPTSCFTPGMVLGYNPTFMSYLTDEEAAFVLLHEIFHYRLKFFEFLDVIGKELIEVVNEGQDLVINVMLREGGWPVFAWASMPKKHNFPEGLSTHEYVNLLLEKAENEEKKKSAAGKGKGGQESNPGSGAPSPKPTCGGGCVAPSKEIEKELDKCAGRGPTEVAAVERKTAQEIKNHIRSQGRGSLPGFLAEWANILEEVSTINWRDVLRTVVHDASGHIISGGDDFSMRRPSKRSHVRRLIRPGLIDHEMTVLFCMDTSGSMNIPMMMDGVKESVGILRQLGIDQAWYMEVDAAVAKEPSLVDLSFFEQPIEFHGRCGTDFRPAFEAVAKMAEKPDLLFYWTDGDGWAPEAPPPNIEVVWGLVPGRHHLRRPAKWGHLVILDDDPLKQKFFADAPVWGEEKEDDD